MISWLGDTFLWHGRNEGDVVYLAHLRHILALICKNFSAQNRPRFLADLKGLRTMQTKPVNFWSSSHQLIVNYLAMGIYLSN